VTGETRHITIERRARYAILPGDPGRVREVWFGLHGYNQLAPRFLRRFSGLDDGTRRIVAPEGLHRQYIDHATRKVGASWMTSEDRLTDIEDYVGYLDRLYDAILSDLAPAGEGVRVVALGFSQGVHTLCRWIAFGRSRIDRAILWGATVPPDLDLETYRAALSEADLQLVVGDTDEYFDSAAIEAHESRLRDAGVRFGSWSYEGGHRLDGETLAALAGTNATEE
jgi:dienelactone hydrolase